MIDDIRKMRAISSRTLADVLRDLLDDKPSEADIRDRWQERLGAVPDVTEEGWYRPPPQGIIVAVANPPSYERTHQPSYRQQSAWPSPDYRLDHESLLYVYASPVHRKTGVIGDLGCSLYRGSNEKLRVHLQDVWKLTMQIAQEATIPTCQADVTFAELSHRTTELIEVCGLHNTIYSINDDAVVNIGHTIPWSDGGMSESEAQVIEHGTPAERADLISGKRRFINNIETLEVSSDIAFTIEPRLSGPGLPTVSFHVVVAFEGGEKEVITEFDPLFELFGMQEWIDA